MQFFHEIEILFMIMFDKKKIVVMFQGEISAGNAKEGR